MSDKGVLRIVAFDGKGNEIDAPDDLSATLADPSVSMGVWVDTTSEPGPTDLAIDGLKSGEWNLYVNAIARDGSYPPDGDSHEEP